MLDLTPFKNSIRELIKEEIKKESAKGPTSYLRLGTIPADYVSGRPRVIFDGEDAATSRTYPYLPSYVPRAGDRVVLAKVGHSWVILGRVEGSVDWATASHTHTKSEITDFTHTHSGSDITSGTLPSGRLSSNQGVYSIDPVFPKTNTTHSTLGGASIGEIALCPGYVSNKLQFVLPTSIEYTADGVTWLPYPDAVDSAVIKNMFLGYNAGGSIGIRGPNNGNWQKIRIVFTSPTYVYLGYFYMYQSTNGHSCSILIERSYGAEVDNYSQVATGTFSGWPGHTLVPHSTIPWNPNPTPGTHSKFVRVTFTPTWNSSYPSNNIYIYNINWYGGYPANSRPELFTWDFDKKVTFPNSIYVNSNLVWHAGNDGAGSGLTMDLAPTSAGTPTDAPPDGAIRVDTANSRLYVRVGGVWKSVALT